MKSTWAELRRYRATRFRLPIFGSLALALCACAILAASATAGELLADPRQLACSLLGCLLLLFSLRLWDDLCDVDRDRESHPERVLCTARSLTPFAAVAASSALLGAALLAVLPEGPFALAVLGGLLALLGAWYAVGRRLLRRRLANAAVVLLKYPALVLALSGPVASGALAAVLGAVYLAFGVHEVVHDPSTLRE